MTSLQTAETLPAAGFSPKRRGLQLLLALFGLAVLAALLWRPKPSLPFETLHPHTQQTLRQIGVAPERVAQGLGLAPANAGIHGRDGIVNGHPAALPLT